MVDEKKPKVNSTGQKQLDEAQKQFEAFDQNIKDLTQERMNLAPTQDLEPQTKISQQDLSKKNELYLKPHKSIGCREKFNEKFRDDYNYSKEYVYFTAENKEIIGEELDLWVRPYPGLPAEEWKVPVNKPLWAPRYVAERIKGCKYHRLVMQESSTTGADGMGKYYGSMVADTTIQRLDAIPMTTRKSVFMGV